MFIPKPKITVKPIQKQDYFLANGEPIPPDKRVLTKHGSMKYKNASRADLGSYNKQVTKTSGSPPFSIRRRIYLAFVARESFRIDGKNKSKSYALGALTFREGDTEVPDDFIRKVKEKLDAFGIDRNQQAEMIVKVRKYISAFMVAFP